jgi:transposase
VLACAEPSAGGNLGVAAQLGLAADTVRKWRERFGADGLAGLADGARPGGPKAGLVPTDAKTAEEILPRSAHQPPDPALNDKERTQPYPPPELRPPTSGRSS